MEEGRAFQLISLCEARILSLSLTLLVPVREDEVEVPKDIQLFLQVQPAWLVCAPGFANWTGEIQGVHRK